MIKKMENSKNKNKTIWDIVKLETNMDPTAEKISILNVEGNWIKNKQKIAETFNNYFLSATKNRKGSSKQSYNNIKNPLKATPIYYLNQIFSNPLRNMKIKSLSTKEVENIIKSLQLKNSSGYDGISTKILKLSSLFISSPLTYNAINQ
jgi:hypothetical protein